MNKNELQEWVVRIVFERCRLNTTAQNFPICIPLKMPENKSDFCFRKATRHYYGVSCVGFRLRVNRCKRKYQSENEKRRSKTCWRCIIIAIESSLSPSYQVIRWIFGMGWWWFLLLLIKCRLKYAIAFEHPLETLFAHCCQLKTVECAEWNEMQ